MKSLLIRVMLVCIITATSVSADSLDAGLGADRSSLSAEQIAARSERLEESTSFSLLRFPEALRRPDAFSTRRSGAHIEAAAREYDLDPMMLAGMIFVESYGDPHGEEPDRSGRHRAVDERIGQGARPFDREEESASARRPSRRRDGSERARTGARWCRRSSSRSTRRSTSATCPSARSWRWRAASAIADRGSAAASISRSRSITWAPAGWQGCCQPTSGARCGCPTCRPRCAGRTSPTRSSTGRTRRTTARRVPGARRAQSRRLLADLLLPRAAGDAPARDVPRSRPTHTRSMASAYQGRFGWAVLPSWQWSFVREPMSGALPASAGVLRMSASASCCCRTSHRCSASRAIASAMSAERSTIGSALFVAHHLKRLQGERYSGFEITRMLAPAFAAARASARQAFRRTVKTRRRIHCTRSAGRSTSRRPACPGSSSAISSSS